MIRELDIDQLRTFLAIVEIGSFARAGEAVAKTQSTVSMQMKRLEERIGCRLFEKQGRRAMLTSDGLRLVDYAQRMVHLNNQTMMEFSGKQSTNIIRLGLPDDYAEHLLPKVLAAFARLNPSIEVTVECQSSIQISEMVERADLDLAIVTSEDLTSIHGEMIRKEPLCWIGSDNLLSRPADKIRLALGPNHCSWRKQATAALEAAHIDHCVCYTSASAVVLTSAVREGLAIAALPESAVRSGCRILSESDGLPLLPDIYISILRRPGISDPHIDMLCNHMRAAIGNIERSSAPAYHAASALLEEEISMPEKSEEAISLAS